MGDAAHAATKSEHNPDANGVVRAMDITHDLAHGVNCAEIVNAIVASKDPRALYIIWNHRIVSASVDPWKWRKYTGDNPHDHHFHISVVPGPALYDLESPWRLDGVTFTPTNVIPMRPSRPLIHIGSAGEHVEYLQKKLGGLVVDGDFGQLTDKAVREFQKKNGLVVDGKVGRYTWLKIG